MKKIKLQLLFIIILFLITSSLAISQNYYVSPNGNDTNSGTEALPWKTIQKACSSATAGSTVFIKAGTYDQANIVVYVQGTANNYITFRNFQNDLVTIRRTDGASYKELFRIVNKSYIRFIGLHISGFSWSSWGGGFILRGNSNNIEIINCEFYNLNGPGGAILSEQDPVGTKNNLLIQGNKVYNCNFGNFGAAFLIFKGYGTNIRMVKNQIYNISSTGTFKAIMFEGRDYNLSFNNSLIDSNIVHDCMVNDGEAISVNGNIEYINISNNLIYNINYIGIDAKGGYGDCPNPSLDFARYIKIFDNIVYDCRDDSGNATGIYLDGSRNCIIERNIVYKSSQGIRIDCEEPGNALNNIIRSNIVYDCDRTGILIGRWNNDQNRFVSNCKVLNNTIFKNLDTNTTIYDADFGCSKSSNCIFKNNIIYKSVRPGDNVRRLINVQLGSSNNIFDYNVYYFPLGQNFVTIDYLGQMYNSFSSYVSSTGQDIHSKFVNPQFMDTVLSNPNLHLKDSSPAIDSGDINFIPDVNEKDIDREQRVYNFRVDCGADEKQPPVKIRLLNDISPINYGIYQNFPNPFNPTTNIRFDIPKSSYVKLIIYDILGREIKTLVNENLNAGRYEVSWDGSSYPSGVYFYKLIADNFIDVKKMVLLK